MLKYKKKILTAHLGLDFINLFVQYSQSYAGFIGKIMPGSLARTCNVATDRLVYQDVCGLSATEPCLGLRIGGRTMPKDAGMC